MSLSTSLPETSSLTAPKADLPSGRRIPVLDGIRGIAVLMVMAFHFCTYSVTTGSILWERVYSTTAGMGWAGVDLFFVLSGFLITGILFDSRSDPHYFKVFYGRRTVRIFPLYYASLTLFFLVLPFILVSLHHSDLAVAHGTKLSRVFAWTYVLNWYEGFKGFDVVPLPLQHFWSLAIEEQFYLVWPFLVLKLSRRRMMTVCGGLITFGLVSRIFMYWIHLPIAAYTWTFCRADELAIGAIIALAARDPGDWKKFIKWAPYVALSALCGVSIVRAFNPPGTSSPGQATLFLMATLGMSLVGIFFGGCLVIAVCLRQKSPAHRFLSSSFLRFFGKYSYGLYVCHFPLVVFLTKAGLNSKNLIIPLHSQFLAIVAVNGIYLAVSVAIAFASWHLFEKHWLKLKELPFLRRKEHDLTGVCAVIKTEKESLGVPV